MKIDCRIYIRDDEGNKVLGRGPCELLERVERCGSLNAASKEMGMAYSKAYRIIKGAELALGFPLLERTTGGRNGGGSLVTETGRECIRRYSLLDEKINRFAEEEFQRAVHDKNYE